MLNVAPVTGDGDTMTIIQQRWPDQTTGTTGTIGDHMGPHGTPWDHMGPHGTWCTEETTWDQAASSITSIAHVTHDN